MTMAHARTIVVDGTSYTWKIKGYKEQLRGWSPRAITLIVLGPGMGKVTVQLQSKHWTEEHEHNTDVAPKHVASLKPSDVATCIRAAIAAGWDPTMKRAFLLRRVDLTDYAAGGASVVSEVGAGAGQ
jgi:hypothetical protein